MGDSYGAQLLRQLEEFRQSEGLTKRSLAKRLGLSSPQTYTNWISRGEVSKTGIDAAIRLLQARERTAKSALASAIKGETVTPRLVKSTGVAWRSEDPGELEIEAIAEGLSRDQLMTALTTVAAMLSRQDQIELAERLLRGVREDLASQ